MDKDNKGFGLEVGKLIEKFNKQKEDSLKSVEDFKKSMIEKFDLQLGKIYKKRDLRGEVNANKAELKKQKWSVWQKLKKAGFKKSMRFLISSPFIYMMFIPAIIMHIFLEIYHQVCFRLYDIPRVKAKDYFIFDRKGLPYLNWFERFNCFYCSYFNCLVAYLREIAGRTERYWCPIKHSKKLSGTHEQYSNFVDYSDGKMLRDNWDSLREFSDFDAEGNYCEDGKCFN